MILNPDGGFPERPNGTLHPLCVNAIKQTSLFVPWSTWGAQKMRTQYPRLPASKVLVLHPGIDLSTWPFRGATAPNERFRILFVAGFALLKGGDTLLAAFQSELMGTCELHIVTRSATTPVSFLDQARAVPNVHLHLDLLPSSDELKRLYWTCDVLVHPTREDVSSWVALEALATGIPVIITAIGGIPDIVIDGKTGLTIPVDDPTALARAVERVRIDHTLRSALVAQGREHVEQQYDAKRNARRLLDAVEELISLRRKPRDHV
jgi:glycosyltransferase involved in cell wall biosynthesis